MKTKRLVLAVCAAVVVMLAVSCSTTKSVSAEVADIEGSWTITEACGVSTAGGMSPAEITFEKGGRLNGNASVNNFFGDYTFNGSGLKLGNLGSTMMLGDHMEIDDAVNKGLGLAATVKAEDGGLSVLDSGGKVVLRLKRK